MTAEFRYGSDYFDGVSSMDELIEALNVRISQLEAQLRETEDDRNRFAVQIHTEREWVQKERARAESAEQALAESKCAEERLTNLAVELRHGKEIAEQALAAAKSEAKAEAESLLPKTCIAYGIRYDCSALGPDGNGECSK